jgi:hypothetical protein
LPRANGRPVSRLDARQRNDRIQLEFVAAYDVLNQEYGRLLEIRADRHRAERAARERGQLQRIERALRRRDALEDHYAPLGVIAEPILREGFVVDLKFTFGNTTAAGEPRGAGVCVFSAQVPLPLPADYELKEVTRGVVRALRALK